MTPVQFPEANAKFCHPSDLEESQCQTIHAFTGIVQGGSVDGSHVVVTAWKPSADELVQLNQGKPIFLSFLGGLPPHFAVMDFYSATHPA